MCASVTEEDAVRDALKGTDAAARPHGEDKRDYELSTVCCFIIYNFLKNIYVLIFEM